jgi:hypothetical protein
MVFGPPKGMKIRSHTVFRESEVEEASLHRSCPKAARMDIRLITDH